MEELIARLEAAENGSRELDNLIAQELKMAAPDDPVGWPPQFSQSLDAALTLVPEGMKLADLSEASLDRAGPWRCGIYGTDGIVAATAKRPTAPLALCIAALKARNESQ